MRAARLFVLVILVTAGPLRAVYSQDTPAVTPEQAAAAAAAEAERQIRIYRATLAEAKDEQTRVDAATLLLFSDIPDARKEVLQALRDETNPLPRAAICRALIVARDKARENKRVVANKAEFIEPLMAALRTESDPNRAELTAQALLMFSYDDIQRQLEALLTEPNVPTIARLNAVRALKYQPDEKALLRLIGLLDSPDPDLAGESKKALEFVGVEAPSDPNGIRTLADALQRRGPETFITNPLILRDWLISRENRNAELRASVTAWEQRYLAALDKLAASQTDDKARSDFLAQQLASSEPSVKLWALGKLEELQKGTGRGKLSDQLKGMLLNLISHRDRRVRLKTASLLSSMWEVNSTAQLLEQLQVEEDPDVRLSIFNALGNVCYYASQPTSPSKVSDEVRKETLGLAVIFLNHPDADRTRSGADVIRKLLEQDGLKPEEVSRYLRALIERYRQMGQTASPDLRSSLIGAMAGLCSTSSVCRAEAGRLYGPVFEQSLDDTADSVRQAAIDGFINVDKVEALKRLRADAVKDPSLAIRMKLTDLAGEVGVEEDLDWLSARLGQAGEGDGAWQAMLRIFRRSGLDLLNRWMTRLNPAVGGGLLSRDQSLSFLAIVEQKSQTDKDAKTLRATREKLFAIYADSNDVAKVTEYMGSLIGSAESDAERQAITAHLVDVCLKLATPNMDLPAVLIEKYLAQKDLDPGDPVAQSIELYVNGSAGQTDPNVLLDKLRQIKLDNPRARGHWRSLLLQWEAFAKARKPAGSEKESN
jgi:hypothetical protein